LTLVCRPTPFVLFIHTSELALKTTDVSDGTTREHGRVFTRSPVLRNPAKRDLVANVQENYIPVLTRTCENGNEGWMFGSAAFIPRAPNQGPFAAFGNRWEHSLTRRIFRRCFSGC
jgi:hypothetical protein